MFPSPREVDRFISVEEEKPKKQISEFPSPLEVDRFISLEEAVKLRKAYNKFPSPLEVHRFISLGALRECHCHYRYRPLAR